MTEQYPPTKSAQAVAFGYLLGQLSASKMPTEPVPRLSEQNPESLLRHINPSSQKSSSFFKPRLNQDVDISRVSPATTLFSKSDGKFYFALKTNQGLKTFKDAVVFSETEYDAQSDTGFAYGAWSYPEIEEYDWVDAPSELRPDNATQRLEDAAGRDRRQLIIDAEAMPFEGEDRIRLVRWLKDYIEQNRDSKDREELVAVAAAIRKCVALLDVDDMNWLAELLEPGHAVQPSLDAELEIAKMVFRRYSVNPPERSDPHPELSERLAEITNDYLRPRVFSRERFSTVAMLATQALLVMRSEKAKNTLEKVNDLPFAWFRQQLRRRMDRVVNQMPAGCAATQPLAEMVEMIQPN